MWRTEARWRGAARAAALGAALLLGALLWARMEPAAGPPERQAVETRGVVIPGGAARLGSGERQKGYGYTLGGAVEWRGRWFHDEPERQVRLAPYWLDLTPVTQAAYLRFVRAAGHRAPGISPQAYQAQGFLVHPYASVRPYLWRAARPPVGREPHPVVLVSQGDAGAYCLWRGGQERRNCRLPSEDEWEFAARGRDGRYFPWGNAWEPERVNTAERGPYGTTPVAALPAGRSPFGLLGMAGNVFQWTSTPGRPGEAILKGCSWDDAGGICRAAARHDRPRESRHILIGFRCACEPPKARVP